MVFLMLEYLHLRPRYFCYLLKNFSSFSQFFQTKLSPFLLVSDAVFVEEFVVAVEAPAAASNYNY